ncbi:MAG: hypothetical protein ACFFDD_13510, partial [Promethearchaeota archaeon]
HNLYQLADDAPADGLLNPVEVEQSGYAASETISARTDSFENLDYDLPLDVAHNWVADLAEVSVWNLEKLYAVNGTYSQGYPGVNVNPNGTIDYYPLGWSANSTDTATYPDDVQLAAYDDSGRQYVMVESQGGKVGQNAFGHEAGTSIVWTQQIQNAPYTEDFLLNFDYFYLRGPLDKNPGVPEAITGNCSITVSIDGTTIWNMSLLTLSQRGIWTNSGVIPISIPSAPTSFVFEIGLVIDGLLDLDKRYDYDNNGIADGIGNAAYITVYLDDVSFIKATPPTPEQVQLEFTTGGEISALTGSMGTYYASITNASYWVTTPVSVSLLANTSVSFDYKTRLLSHRFTDSNWRTDITSFGVAYTVDHGLSSDLTFYTYVGYLGDYEDPEMMIVFPTDWKNLTVSDPFLTDLTSSCTIGVGNVTVPTSIIDRLGWWEVKLESPNYAKSIKSQVLDGGWTDETIFRIGESTRANVTIGTDTQTLSSLTDVNITWFKPSDEIWVSELLTGGVLGQIYSNPQVLSSGSSPAGVWWVEVFWSNGTEVAYDRAGFEVHHTANLVADPTEISTETGASIKGLVRYTDGDTNAPILDAITLMEGNWSAGSVSFVANPVQNWWEADFDTSVTGAGDFVIVVNASRVYYDDVSCQIQVHVTNVTRLTSPNAPWTASEWGSIVPLKFKFESYHLGTDTWWPVTNASDVEANVNWTAGYWSISEDVTPGLYNMNLDTNIVTAGTWLLNVTFTKPYHETKTIFLTLILSPMTSSLSVVGNLSERVDLEEPTSVKVHYEYSNGTPISGAVVAVDSVSPASGLSYGAVTEVGGEPGNYTVTMTPFAATVYTVRFVATGSYSEPASTIFVLVVNDVETNLIIYGNPSIEIGLTETYNTTFRYEMINGTGVINAATSIVYSGPVGRLSWNISESGLGNYSVEFSASLPGTYVITTIAFKPFHQRASSSFSLIVQSIPTNLQLSVETSSEMGLTDTYEMTILYEMYNGTGIEDALIKVIHSGNQSAITSQVTPLGSGNYSIQFNATLSGGYLITIAASKQYCQGNSDSFLLSVLGIPTFLVSLNGSADFLGFGKDYRLFVNYTDDAGNELVGANVSIISADVGITWNQTQIETPGVYSILLTPLTSNTFTIVVEASLTNYQIRRIFFTLTVTAIPTTLTILTPSTSISVDQNFTVLLSFQDEDSNDLENATLDVLNPPPGIEYSAFQELGAGVYNVTLTPLTIGTFDIVFTASKDGYQTDYAGYALTATIIQTEIQIAGGLSSHSISYSQRYEILVLYTRSDTGGNISGAIVTVQTPSSGLVWNSSEEIDGGYTITLDPQNSGNYTLYIFATKIDYEESSTQFRLEVEQIKISVEFVSELSAVENLPFTLRVRLVEAGTTKTIDDAFVAYRFSVTRVGAFKQMNSTGNPGEYSITLSVPLFSSSIYRLEIKV